ncbi:MAG: phosphotransferase [Anaerolineae bacterium]|nr:phosphotransferase [Anaerolineae bacterium]
MMIPEAKQAAVIRALSAAFGVQDFDDIRLLTGGLSPSLVFRMIVRGQPYLLRVIVRRQAVYDPTREFACMKLASEAGIAPRIWYANVEDMVLITDFVEAKPFPDDMALRLAPTIRRLHSLPHFPTPQMGNYLDVMDGLVRRFQTARLLPDSITEELFRGYSEVIRVYPRHHTDLVASHNDLKPQNIVFDGERSWLVDWEAAFLNDPYVDLAVAANFFVKDEAQAEDYLRAYFGEPAGDYRRARFTLMRQAMHVFYAAFLMLQVAGSGLPIASDMTAPDFREFHQRLISGEVGLVTAEERLQYARVH